MFTEIPATFNEIELSYKPVFNATACPVISTSSDAYDVCCKIWNAGRIELQEEFKVLLLNRANRVMGVYHCSQGGLTGTVADPRLILAAALKSGAVSILLAHNHPSGNLKPSRADEELTRKVNEAAKFMDIKVLDHLIVTVDGYFSFADEGVI